MSESIILNMPRVPSTQSADLPMDLTKVYFALNRIEEISVLTSFKAQELMTCFNKAFLVLGRYSNAVLLERNKADSELRRIRARLVLDEIPAKLAAKGLKDTKSNQDAMCEVDPDYASTKDVLDKLGALQELFKGNMKSLEMAYMGAKKVLGDRNPLLDQRVEINAAQDLNARWKPNPELNPQQDFSEEIEYINENYK